MVSFCPGIRYTPGMGRYVKKVRTFDLTSNTDRTEYEMLVNKEGVVVHGTNDFFAPGGCSREGDAISMTLERVIDYAERDEAADPLEEAFRRLYPRPIS